jgi:hypothetical protein
MRKGTLQAVPLINPEIIRDVAIISARNRPPIPSQRQVLETVRQQIVHLVNSGAWAGATLV